jgi:menaquinone-dependent protoporphyrinogen oxidase
VGGVGTAAAHEARRTELDDMNVLVAVASRHGSTQDIADCIGQELEALGIKTEVMAAEIVSDLQPYNAVVLGSAVYGARWLWPAKELGLRLAAETPKKPVWLFSSGPIGRPPCPIATSPDGAELRRQLGAADHRVFRGRIDRARLDEEERAIVSVADVPSGDDRDWDAITDWARLIAQSLASPLRSGSNDAEADEPVSHVLNRQRSQDQPKDPRHHVDAGLTQQVRDPS